MILVQAAEGCYTSFVVVFSKNNDTTELVQQITRSELENNV